jgi:hypothetical protein
MGLFSAIGSLFGGGSQKKAIKQATKAQVQMADKAIAEQRRQFDVTQANFEPYRADGVKGLAQLGDLVGINGGDKQASAIEMLKASPFYQSLFRTGEEAVLQNASATGGADTLMATIERQLASLGGLAGMGMGATESVANFGQNKANAVSGLFKDQGNAIASGALARGGVNAQMWKNAGSILDSIAGAFLGGGF